MIMLFFEVIGKANGFDGGAMCLLAAQCPDL